MIPKFVLGKYSAFLHWDLAERTEGKIWHQDWGCITSDFRLLSWKAPDFPPHIEVDEQLQYFPLRELPVCMFSFAVLWTLFRQEERTRWQRSKEDRPARRRQLLSGTPAFRPCSEWSLSPPEEGRKLSSSIHSCNKATRAQELWRAGLPTWKSTLPRATARNAQESTQLQIRSIRYIVRRWRTLRDRNVDLQVQNSTVFIVHFHVHGSYSYTSRFAGWETSEENTP